MPASAQTFYFNDTDNPTNFNLSQALMEKGWVWATSPAEATFSDQHLAMSSDVTESLEFKHRLAELVAANCADIMPATEYVDDNNWLQVHDDWQKQSPSQIRILKPALLNNGEHIQLFTEPQQLKAHYQSTQRLAGSHVLQEYIANPHCLASDYAMHKYSCRLFVVATSQRGAFLYSKGYFNIAKKPYIANDFSDLSRHLTNEHLNHAQANVTQVPTSYFKWFPDLFPKMQGALTQLMRAFYAVHEEQLKASSMNQMALFGMDFMIDEEQGVWFLEANHGPCFPMTIEHPLQQYLYEPFWHAVVDELIVSTPPTDLKTAFTRL